MEGGGIDETVRCSVGWVDLGFIYGKADYFSFSLKGGGF